MSAAPVDYDAIAKQMGAVSSEPAPKAGTDYAAIAKQYGATDSQPAAQQPSAAKRFGSNLYDQTLGQIVPAIKTAFGMDELSDAHKLFQEGKHAEGLSKVAEWATKGAAGRMGQGIVDTSIDQGKKAVESVKQGHPGDAVGHAAAAVPVIGTAFAPSADAVDQARSGDWAGAAGKAAGNLGGLATMALPERVTIIPKAAPDAAVGYADANQIPISAATRTGNKFVRNVQAIASNQPIASSIAKNAIEDTRQGLSRTADLHAQQAAPGPSVSPETAGAGVASKLSGLSKKQGAGAFKAYGQLEQIENDPANLAKLVKKNADTGQFEPNPIATPVNMKAAKAAVVPIIARLEQEMPLAQQQSSRGLLALRNIAGMDDIVPASVADQNLSALKQLQRESVHPKTQFLVNQAVNAVAPAVDAGVAKAGPLATAALNEGRALTKAKYATDATLEQLNTEPVRLFKQLTTPGDTSINLLRDVQSKTPDALPAVGRAYLEGLFESATKAEGVPGSQATTALSQWNKLGDATKRALYPNPALRNNLDNFFNLAKKVSENPNPSGSATVGSSLLTLSEGGLMLHNPVAGGAMLIGWPVLTKMLYSPQTSKILQNGLRLPVKSPAAAIVGGSIMRAAGIEQPKSGNGGSSLSQSTAQPATAGTPQ